jgi:hypothetical protein
MACDDPHMVEYGNGVSGVAGQVAGTTGGPGGRTIDVGATAGQFISDSMTTLSALPPAALLGLGVLVLLGLVMVRKAF